jgi:signal transduction histidine kinase/CheY-like chemotaxis protein
MTDEIHVVMSARLRLKIIFLLTILLIAIFVLALNSRISSRNYDILENRLADSREDHKHAISIANGPFYFFVFDYSYWDELITFYKTRDPLWPGENILQVAPKYKADYLWLLDTLGGKVLFVNKYEEASPAPPNIAMPALIDSLRVKPFRNFFIRQKNQLIEISTAPLQPSSDVNRITPPQGYFIAGKEVDSSSLVILDSANGESHYRLLPYNSRLHDTIDVKNGDVINYYTLSDLFGRPLNTLQSVSHFPVLHEYQQFILLNLLLFAALVALTLFAVYQLARIYFFKPLETISDALVHHHPGGLKSLTTRRDEFREIAQLVATSFVQNDLLIEEIDSRRKSEMALQEALKDAEKAMIEKLRAEQADIAKSEFLSTMSHEIRTPINGVIGITNLLMEEDLTPRQKEYVNILNFSSQHLMSIVSDILDFSKIESGNIEFDKSPFDLLAVCQHVYQLFKPKADEKRLQFDFVPDESIACSLYGDHVRLSQVLTNLLSNAIKFTNTGSVHFAYRTLSDSNHHLTIEFTVSDTGIGIETSQQKRIFDSFVQAGQPAGVRYDGTGLGLTISKKLIEMQGGKISVESESGKGSLFRFFLRFEKHAFVSSLLRTGTATMQRQKSLEGMKVLVAEDNEINVFVLCRFLSKWGIDAQVVGNGRKAVQAVQQGNYDLVLMDLQMPEMDGMEAVAAIRQLDSVQPRKIPIIALTADASSDMQQEMLAGGFDHYLTKPFNPDNLYRLLKKYFGG